VNRRFKYPFLLTLAAITPGVPAQSVSSQPMLPLETVLKETSTTEVDSTPVPKQNAEPAPLANTQKPAVRLVHGGNYDVEDLLEYLRQRECASKNEKQVCVGDYSTLDGISGNKYTDAISQFDDRVMDEERRRRANSLYGEREPWGLFVELRTTVDKMTREEKMRYLAIGQGPSIVDLWICGAMPKQHYLDRVMGAIDESIGPKGGIPEAEQITRRNNEPIREPTTGGKNAPLTPEEEARLDEVLIGLTPVRIVVPPIRMPDGTTRSHFQSSQSENERIGREATVRELQLYGSAEKMIRMNQLRSRRDAETTIFLHERPRLLNADDGIATVNSLHAFARAGNYDQFAAKIVNNTSSLPTRLVIEDSDFYKPFDEMKRRQLFETLRQSTIEELCVSALDTGLGQEVGLLTKINDEFQELKLVVRKEGVVGVTLDSAFDFYGRWDLPEYTALELASKTLEDARRAANSHDFESFLQNVQLGVEHQPTAPDAQGLNPEPINQGILERFYKTLAGALGLKTDVWRGDHGEGIQVHVNLENGTQYIVAVRQNRIIGLSVYSGG